MLSLERCIKCAKILKMLQNEYVLAKIGFDTAENGPRHVGFMIRAREPRFGIVSVHAFQEKLFRKLARSGTANARNARNGLKWSK